MFETNCKELVDRISKSIPDLTELGVLVQRCKTILRFNPIFNVCFVKRQVNGIRIFPSLPSLYNFNHVLSCVEHLILNEML